MNGAPRDGQGPSHRECLLPSVARTLSATQVTPAKKITFLKRGDPRFAGVRLAVHQRTFKTFNALMDELSHRVPLAFGVRSVTTPRGLHGLNALEQLQDGGCYLCSDKQPPKTPSRLQGRSSSALQSWDPEGQVEMPGTTPSGKVPRAPRRMTLVRNGDPRFRQTVVLSHRNTRNLAAFLSKASDLLHFPVKQVYTLSGKKVDSLQSLLRCPSVLVCAGDEAFRPPLMEDAARNGSEMLSGLSSRGKNGSWGPESKQSVIHARTGSGSGQARRLALLSESRPHASLHHAQRGPAPIRHPQDTAAVPGPLVAGDDVEKKVHLNEDGSLSVEMRVRFQLLGDEALLWSQRVGRAASREDCSSLGEAEPFSCTWQGAPWGSSESGARASRALEAGFHSALGHSQQPEPSYEIWRNPLYTCQGEGLAAEGRPGVAQYTRCRRRWSQGTTGRQRSLQDSASPASTIGCLENSELEFRSSSRTIEGDMNTGSLQLASPVLSRGADDGLKERPSPCPEAVVPQSGGRRPETQGSEEAPSDWSTSAGSPEVPSEGNGLHQGCQRQARARSSKWPCAQGSSLCAATLSPLSLANENLQGEKPGQDIWHGQARSGSGSMGPLLAVDHDGLQHPERGHSPLDAQQGGGRQMSPANAVSSPCSLDHVCCHHRGTHHLLHSPAAQQVPRSPDSVRASPCGSMPQLSEHEPMIRKLASGELRSPSLGSVYSQDLQSGARGVTLTPGSNPYCACSPRPATTPSTEPAGGTENREHLPAPTPASTPHSYPQSGAGSQWGEAMSTPGPSPPLILLAGQPEGREPEAPQGCGCSPIGMPEHFPEAPWACSGYHPTPPEGRPCAKKPLRNLSHTSSGDPSADGWEADGGQQAEEKLKEGPLQLSGPGSAAVGTTVRGSLNPETGPRGMLEVKAARIGPGLKELEDDGSMTPSALPHASPDAVVREWLGNIPEEPVLMRYEVDETSGMAREGPEGPQESPVDDQGQGGQQLLLEVDISEHVAPKVEAKGVLPGPSDTGTESRQASPQGQGAAPAPASNSPVEVRALTGAAGALDRASCALPGRVSASTQIMKVLMGAKPGRPSSLPELSDVVTKRLSHSAVALIACLARLHFFDKDPGSPVDKVSFTDSPQYQELLSISQTLWPRCSSGQDVLDSELQELPPHKPLPMTEDLTPTSSSGVDVSSGSGGSGEGSVPCAMDSTGVPERTEPLLKSSFPRPGSRASGHAENVEEPQPGCSAASASSQTGTYATSKQAAEGGSREQLVGNTLEQEIENVVQEDGVQLEETKEAENEEPHAGIQEEGLPMGTCVSRLGSSEAGSAGSEGSQDDKREHKEEARPCPSDRSENPLEPSQPLSEGPSKTSDSQRGPRSDPGLEEPPTAAAAAVGVSHKQAQVRPWLQLHAGEANRCTACRACLDPDPTWVSKLLKKMQMSFLTHLADATAQLRARWNLQDDGLLDQMVAELEQDLGQRLQASTDKELRKIQSRAGRRAQGSGPAWEVLRGQTSLQTEQRRHRLHGLRNLSALTDQTCGRGLFSLSLEDARSAPGEEFCPCKVCLRKKVTPVVSPREAGAPIKKAFDLQQILQKKKEGCPKGEAEAVATKRKAVTPKQEDLGVAMDMSNSGQGANGGQELGSDIELGAKEGDGGEGSQRFSRDKEPPAGDAEGAGGQESGDNEARGQEEELGGGQEEQRPMLKGSEEEDSLEAAALEGSSWTAGQDDGGATAAEVPGAGGEGLPGSEGGSAGDTEGNSQGHPGASQLAEASENSSPDQGRRPASSPAPQGDTPKQRPDPQPRSSSSLSAPGCDCPPAHQKGPASELPSGDRRNSSAEPQGTPPPDTRVTARCPGSSPLEQEGCPSCPRTPEQGAGYACYESQGEEVVGTAHTQVGDKADGFGQDDLDF